MLNFFFEGSVNFEPSVKVYNTQFVGRESLYLQPLEAECSNNYADCVLCPSW